MKKLLIALTALPFMAGVAAGQPQQLTDKQMDKVSAAGFSAVAIADAQGLVGALQTLVTTTSAVSVVIPITSTLFLSISEAHSSSVTIPGP
jgi:hypothetical protein